MDGIEAELDREELIALVVDLLEMIDKLRKENAACRRTRRQASHAAVGRIIFATLNSAQQMTRGVEIPYD